MIFPTIEAQTQIQTPPTWAVLERQLIDKMNAAGPRNPAEIHASRRDAVLADTSRFSEYRRTGRCIREFP